MGEKDCRGSDNKQKNHSLVKKVFLKVERCSITGDNDDDERRQ